MAQRAAGGLFRRSLGLAPPTTPRALSTSATTPAAAAEGEAAAKARRNKKKNLFDVAQFLPDWASATGSPRPPGATSPTRSPRSTSTRMAGTGRRGGFGTRPVWCSTWDVLGRVLSSTRHLGDHLSSSAAPCSSEHTLPFHDSCFSISFYYICSSVDQLHQNVDDRHFADVTCGNRNGFLPVLTEQRILPMNLILSEG